MRGGHHVLVLTLMDWAGSLASLGWLMALWLEGRFPGEGPGYAAPFGYEEHDGAGHLADPRCGVSARVRHHR